MNLSENWFSRHESFPARVTLWQGGTCHQDQAIFGRTDRGGAKAGGAWRSSGRLDPEGRHLGADLPSMEEGAWRTQAQL